MTKLKTVFAPEKSPATKDSKIQGVKSLDSRYHYPVGLVDLDQIKGLKTGKFCDDCNATLPTGDLKDALQALLAWRY